MPGELGQDKTHGALVARGREAGDIERPEGGVLQDERLVIIADYVCPFCYLAEVVAGRIRERGALPVEAAAFELRPAGVPLPPAAVHPVEEWRRTVALARELGVTMRPPALPTRTRKAHEAVAYARSIGAAQPLHETIYRAYWQEGRDIGRIDVLADIARGAGLDPVGVRVALDIDQWTERVEQDEAWAAALGIREVPAYVLTRGAVSGSLPVAGELRLGLQRYEELLTWLYGDDIRADHGGAGA